MNMGSVESLSNLQAAQVKAQINVAVLAKTHDAAKLQGEAAVELIESAAEVGHDPHDGHDGHLNVTA